MHGVLLFLEIVSFDYKPCTYKELQGDAEKSILGTLKAL